ncbi:MAG: type III-B CRISPR module RAMP protein Cmr1, partial [Chroococcidiopsidaceae cyanobacterium CP_BM_RX_35]|nr:type III-B CRISPR module RAMP protein Cmr1 [Chroococcidiopsidaceae cyanobacterium CP_BM_RX_35]
MKAGYNNKNLADIWREFSQSEFKTGSKLGKAFEKAGFGGYEDKTLILYFEDESLSKTARGQSEPLKRKLPRELQPCDRIDFRIGNVPAPSQTSKPTQAVVRQETQPGKKGNPLQALNLSEFGQDSRGNELSQPLLNAAVQAERSCSQLYRQLRQRTEALIRKGGTTLIVDFNWRVRVGGTRGFRELLLPVFHPVFGIPYIPASSLKGAVRAWARKGEDSSEVQEILGMLDGKVAKAAKVEFLDAFPTKPCLSVDVATPQWHWQNNKVAYKPEPHPLLSMEQPQFLIGLRPTKPENVKYISVARDWLENALKTGIGSRVSSGYGRALGQTASLPYSQSFNFELWTQGMYGSEPPTRQNNWNGSPEFRPTAIRGILRYWFRAFALSLYDAATCQTLEETLFGQLSQQGQFSLSVLFNPSSRSNPYLYTGKICLEATEQKYLTLLSHVLILASHLGGVGRGSRRPLHLLNRRMRGSHWIVDNGANLPFKYDAKQWQQFCKHLTAAFEAVRSPIGIYTSIPGKRRQRQQDVLDKNAQIWLLKSTAQISPDKVSDWQEGNKTSVLGSALSLLYSDTR